MGVEQRKILFSGRVQGVGFRMTAVQLAKDLAVSGTVKNLPDGGVELIVRGSVKELDLLVARIGEHFGAFVRSVDQQVVESGKARAGDERGIRVIS